MLKRKGEAEGGCLLIVLLFNLAIGGICFDYCLYHVFGKNVHWFADVVCGLFLGEITVPLAIVLWILRAAGLETPLLNQ